MDRTLNERETMQVSRHLSKTGNSSEPFLSPIAGEERFFAGAGVPDGWIEANGAAVSRTVYAALFARVGTTFGVGDGSTTFNLPTRTVPTGYIACLKV